MKLKRLTLPLSLLPIAILLVILSNLNQHKHEGKTLDEWLKLAENADTRSNAFIAIRAMGPKNIPDLLRKLQKADPPMTREMAERLVKQDMDNEAIPAVVMRKRAVLGFEALGSMGKPAIAALEKQLSNTNCADEVISSLRAIGPDACDALIRGMTNENIRVRVGSMVVIFLIGASNDQAVASNIYHQALPSIIHSLRDTNAKVRYVAAGVSGEIKQEPQVVIPELIRLLSDEDEWVRFAATRSLTNFGPLATSAVPALVVLLNDSLGEARKAASNALLAIDPEAAAKAGVK